MPERYKDLKKSLVKNGQQYPIHRCKFGIIDGYKRIELLIGEGPTLKDKGPRFIDHPEIKTVDQYIELLKATQPVVMTAEERRSYIRRRGRELKDLNITAEEVVNILKRLTGVTKATIYRNLPDDVKQEYKKVSNETLGTKGDISKKKVELISRIREEFDWLNTKDIQKILKDPLKLLTLAKQHYEGLKTKPTIKAELPELISVLYAKLEAANFPKLDESSMRWWKFLAKEYNERFSKDEE